MFDFRLINLFTILLKYIYNFKVFLIANLSYPYNCIKLMEYTTRVLVQKYSGAWNG